MTVPGSSSSSPLLLAGLALSLLFNLVVGGYVLTQVAAARRVDSRWAGIWLSQVIGKEKLTMITTLETRMYGDIAGQDVSAHQSSRNNMDFRYVDNTT